LEPEVKQHNVATSSWKSQGRAEKNRLMRFQVPLKVGRKELMALEKTFFEVSDPDHERYGQHLSIEDVRDLLAVPEKRIQRVRTWLEEHSGKVELNAHRDTFTVIMRHEDLERMVNTEIHRFVHKDSEKVSVYRAAKQYYVPIDISHEINMIGELLQFPALKDKKLTNLKGSGQWPNSCKASGCAGLVQPAVLDAAYNVPNATLASDTANGNAMAVAEFQGQYFKTSDLKTFSDQCNRDVTVDKIIGGNENSAGIEAELDIEYIKSIAPSIPLTVVYATQYSLLDWVNQISGTADTPKVHSVSYGNDEKQQSSRNYMLTCNTAFQKAGAQGISILFASGDQGVCGREGCGFFKKTFKPDFPAASPYITAVGGTDFYGDGIGPEQAWQMSGGGFSNNFGIPSYQADFVATYKKTATLPKSSYYNNTGRGYPDVAALGGLKTPYCVAVNGRFEGVAGTSASTPVVAGIFARLNGMRLANGKSVLGFLNPWIYKNPSVFNDVVHGNNNDGGSAGFDAIKGWDPATGLGTPDFKKMAAAI